MFYGYPGDAFSKTADYLWNASGGTTRSYKPLGTTNSIYRPGVNVLVSGVKNNDNAKNGNPTIARQIITADYVAYGNKTSNTTKGEIHYVGAHDQSGSISGNIVILQTLLQLGIPPTVITPVKKEVARSSPISVAVGGQPVLVQGTFRSVVPN